MSCSLGDRRNQLFAKFKTTVCTCTQCGGVSRMQDEFLPFGESLMTTWICDHCQHQDMRVINEQGQLLELSGLDQKKS